MGLFESLVNAVQSPASPSERLAGAFWCHDCENRLRLDAVADADVDDPTTVEPPTCPDCGDQMEFERSSNVTGCAC